MNILYIYIYIVPRCLPTKSLIPSRLNMLRPKSLVVVAAKGAHVLLQKQFANTSAIIFEIPVGTPGISYDLIMVLPQEKRLVEKKIVGGNHLRVLYWTAGGVLLQLDLPSAISSAMLASGATQRSICSIRLERICRKCLTGLFLCLPN